MTVSTRRRVLVLGASGMMGSTILRVFAGSENVEVSGTVRSDRALARLPWSLQTQVAGGVDASDWDAIGAVLERVQPAVVINCIGIVKQLALANDPLVALPVNSMFPHQLARLLVERGVRLVQLSSDCVFDGKGSRYREADFASADDLYGRSKFLGEVDYPNAITLRTSTIGHELGTHHGLLEWFLAQSGQVRGYRRAIYSGLTTVELARVIRDYVLPRPELTGLYHVSGDVIDKHSLLLLIRDVYGKDIAIDPDDSVVLDRSLDSSRFRDITGYAPPPWIEQIREMREFG